MQADEYAKGMLALGLVPGKDNLCSIGMASMEAACLFTASSSIGVGYSVSALYNYYINTLFLLSIFIIHVCRSAVFEFIDGLAETENK